MSKKSANITQKNDAKRLSTTRTKTSAQTPTTAATVVEENRTNVENALDVTPTTDVPSSQMTSETAMTPSRSTNTNTNTTSTQEKIMEITLTRSDKSRKTFSIVYTSPALRGAVHFAKSAFVDNAPPDTITVISDSFVQPKVKETKEERKARLAAAPKLTLAEKIAKREAALQRDRERFAKQQEATAAVGV